MAENVTADAVKELRQRTGAGMMDCKKALVQADGDLAKAEEIIAQSGHRKAAKSAARVAAEGLIASALGSNNKEGAIVEVNCETDFVGRDETFITFCDGLVQTILKHKITDVEKIKDLIFANSNETVENTRLNLIAKIGENVQIRRAALMDTTDGVVGLYVHRTRIGVIIKLKGGNPELAKDVAMHIAAMNPTYIKVEDIPSETIAKEKAVLIERAKQSGKPDNIVEKIVEGQLSKHFGEMCLTGQPFVKNPDMTVGLLLKEGQASVVDYIRFEVGEGIEVKKVNFQEEVMAQARGSR